VDAVTSKMLTELLAAVKVPYAVYRCGSSMRATSPSARRCRRGDDGWS
jgi:hypothetical protein